MTTFFVFCLNSLGWQIPCYWLNYNRLSQKSFVLFMASSLLLRRLLSHLVAQSLARRLPNYTATLKLISVVYLLQV